MNNSNDTYHIISQKPSGSTVVSDKQPNNVPVSKTVGGILESSTNTSPKAAIDFISETPEGVFINISTPSIFKSLDVYISDIIKNGKYFIDFDYPKIAYLLFEMRVNSLVFPLKPIKIASKLLPVSTERMSLYRKLLISPDKKSVDYFFEPVYTHSIDASGKSVEEQASLDIDEFIAHLWNNGIHHGIDIKSIKEAISGNGKGRIRIAGETPPTDTIDATLEEVTSFDIKRGPKNGNTNAKVNLLVFEQGYLKVEADDILFRKKPGILGKNGWTIYGEKIDPKPVQDFDIVKYQGNGVVLKIINGNECLCSEINGSPHLEYRKKGKNTTEGFIRVHVYQEHILESIGMNTGEVDVLEKIVSERDIDLDIKNAKSVHGKANVTANINAEEDIRIDGNISGTANRTQRGTSITRGRIISEGGNIQLRGLASDTYLEAKSGIIKIGKSENSFIIGKNVEIHGIARNSTIVGDTVTINGETIGCQIIAKNIIVLNSSNKGAEENVFTIFSHDLTPRIEEKERMKQKIIQGIEVEFDNTIMSEIQTFEKLQAEKRIGLTKIFVSFMLDPEKQKDTNYEKLLGLYQLADERIKIEEQKLKRAEQKFEKNKKGWDKINELKTQLTKLSEEIEAATLFMKQQIQTNSIDIKVTTAPTHIRHLRYSGEIRLFDLLTDEIKEMTKLQPGREIAQYCDIQALPVHTSGKFSWKAI